MTVLDFSEGTWTIIALLCAILFGYLLKDGLLDLEAARLPSATNGRRGIFAAMYVRHLLLFTLLSALNSIIGLASIFAPAPNNPNNLRLVYATAAIAFELMMLGVAVLDVVARRQIRTYKARVSDPTKPH